VVPDGQIEDVIAGARAVVAEDTRDAEEIKREALRGPGSEGGRSR